MKTLDEVIKGLDICKNFSYCTHPQKRECPYVYEDNTCGQDDLYRDALHYLKEYKKFDETMCALPDYYEWLHSEDNPPLKWDELQQMEGKPVWVEVYDPIDEKTGWHNASWRLIEFINDEYFDVRDSDGEQECYYKSECEFWQAYRKER